MNKILKHLGIITVLVFTFSFSINIFASDSKEESITCSKESDQKCETKEHAASGKDWSHKRQEQVAAIFPEKTKKDGATARPLNIKIKAPSFLEKINGSEVKLSWSTFDKTETFHIQVSKDAGFNNRSMMVIDEKQHKGTELLVNNLEANTKYFWRVAAFDNQHESQFTKSTFVFSAFETK